MNANPRRLPSATGFGGPVLLILALGLSGCGASEPEVLPASIQATTADSAGVHQPPFNDFTNDAGLDFTHFNGMNGQLYFVEMMGGGGALFDYDDDGDLDLYAVQGALFDDTYDDLVVPYQGPRPPRDRLFRNDLVETGTVRFTDVTDAAGLRATGYGMGATTGDIDNDGDLDLYVTNWGANQLWRNNGDGTFFDVTAESGTGDDGWTVGASFFDYDRDGYLDLMVVNYDVFSLENSIDCFSATGRITYCGPDAYPDAQDRLFRNQGDGTFENVTLKMGIAAAFGSGLGVVAADFNDDGWPDLAVSNDADENQLWINQQGRRFENQANMAGVAVNAAGSREAGMGIVAADFDGNGTEDLFMTHMLNETNTLYLNLGDALFDDRTRRSGLGRASLAYTAFGVSDLDLDNDGWLDLFIVNGAVRIILEQVERGDIFPLKQPNQLFRNLGQGRFEEITPENDPFFALEEVSRGTAAGDIDNDGDLDVVLFNNNGPARLLRNEIGQQQSWLGLRLLGTAARRDMLGARVELRRADAPALWRRAHTDGSYASARDPRVLFGLGDTATYDAVHVHWPDGTVEAWNDLAVNRYHTLVQGQGAPVDGP